MISDLNKAPHHQLIKILGKVFGISVCSFPDNRLYGADADHCKNPREFGAVLLQICV